MAVKSRSTCNFFLQGRCSRGETCKFSHDAVPSTGLDPSNTYAQQRPEPPPPIIIDIPPGSASIFSIDVECVATGAVQ